MLLRTLPFIHDSWNAAYKFWSQTVNTYGCIPQFLRASIFAEIAEYIFAVEFTVCSIFMSCDLLSKSLQTFFVCTQYIHMDVYQSLNNEVVFPPEKNTRILSVIRAKIALLLLKLMCDVTYLGGGVFVFGVTQCQMCHFTHLKHTVWSLNMWCPHQKCISFKDVFCNTLQVCLKGTHFGCVTTHIIFSSVFSRSVCR
jgi:hypothetical protein